MTILDAAPPATCAPDPSAPLAHDHAPLTAPPKMTHTLAEMPSAEEESSKPDETEPPSEPEREDEEPNEQPDPDDGAESEPEPVEEEHPASASPPSATEPAPPGRAPGSPGSSGSLASPAPAPARPGELQDKVANFLADHPGRAYTVTEVTKETEASSGGAVGNALKTLASDGRIVEASSSPRKYTARTPDPYRPTPTTRPPLALRTPRGEPARHTTPATPARPAMPPTPAPDPKVPITRRNGQLYYPRQLGAHTDVEVLHKLRATGISALLEGPPGTGKTSLVEAAFPDLVLVAGDGDTQVADLVGSYTIADDGGYVWNYGPAVTAALEGRPLFIDDATLISPKVLAVIYPLMDGRREIVVKEHQGETVTAADGFYVIAGHNPHVHGAVLSDALASRFTAPIQVSTDYELAEHLGVHKKAVQIARNLATQQRNGATGWAPQMRELLAFKAIATVLGEDAAFGNMIGQAPADDRELVTAVVTKILGRPVTPLALGKQAR